MRTLSLIVVLLLVAPALMAQATRTWISGLGDDFNPCSRTAPCKIWAGAISHTAAGGEIGALDAGGFGTLTITKSITIDGGGAVAGTLAALTQGFLVNAGPTDKVIIRNVSINGSLSPAGAGLPPLNTPRGTNGIRYIGGAQLTVENVTIIGFGTRGIEVALAAAGELTVRNTRITECAQGVKLTTSSGQLLASFDDLTLNNNSVPFGTTGNLLSTGNNRVEGNGGGAPPVLSTYTVR